MFMGAFGLPALMEAGGAAGELLGDGLGSIGDMLDNFDSFDF